MEQNQETKPGPDFNCISTFGKGVTINVVRTYYMEIGRPVKFLLGEDKGSGTTDVVTWNGSLSRPQEYPGYCDINVWWDSEDFKQAFDTRVKITKRYEGVSNDVPNIYRAKEVLLRGQVMEIPKVLSLGDDLLVFKKHAIKTNIVVLEIILSCKPSPFNAGLGNPISSGTAVRLRKRRRSLDDYINVSYFSMAVNPKILSKRLSLLSPNSISGLVERKKIEYPDTAAIGTPISQKGNVEYSKYGVDYSTNVILPNSCTGVRIMDP